MTPKQQLAASLQKTMGDRRIDIVAEKTHMSKPTITRIRDGVPTIKTATLIHVANYLGVDVPEGL